LETRAKTAMNYALSMGTNRGLCSTGLAVRVWQAIVRPILEIAGEVTGEKAWKGAEQLQEKMGRKILRCSKHTTGAAVRGELGWETTQARRDLLRLMFWRRLLLMPESRIVKHVYMVGRSDLEAGVRTRGWAAYTKKLMEELDLSWYWENERVGGDKTDWKKIVKDAIAKREEKNWREELQAKPKLRTYKLFKQKLKREKYLAAASNTREGLKLRTAMARLRTGSSCLRVETGRHENLAVEERVCLVCNSGEVEDEAHFLLKCPGYVNLREGMIAAAARCSELEKEEFTIARKDEALRVLMNNNKTVSKAVGLFVVKAFAARKRKLKEAERKLKETADLRSWFEQGAQRGREAMR
jgi:hypothetical protein